MNKKGNYKKPMKSGCLNAATTLIITKRTGIEADTAENGIATGAVPTITTAAIMTVGAVMRTGCLMRKEQDMKPPVRNTKMH